MCQVLSDRKQNRPNLFPFFVFCFILIVKILRYGVKSVFLYLQFKTDESIIVTDDVLILDKS